MRRRGWDDQLVVVSGEGCEVSGVGCVDPLSLPSPSPSFNSSAVPQMWRSASLTSHCRSPSALSLPPLSSSSPPVVSSISPDCLIHSLDASPPDCSHRETSG